MKIARKAVLLAAFMALGSSPAWALAGGKGASHGPASVSSNGAHGHAESNGAGEHGKGNSKGAGSSNGAGNGHKGSGKHSSSRCVSHSIAYVSSGTLVSEALTEGPEHTYSGTVTVQVQHGNSHSRSDQGTQKTYTVQRAHLALAVPDRDKDSLVGVDDLAPGDRVQLIGHITALAKGCPAGEFTPQLTIEKIVFHGPRHGATSTSTSTTTTSTTS